MKGVVFRVFESFIEDKWGAPLADEMMSDPNLSSGGAYTGVGNYPHSEFLTIAAHLSSKTDVELDTLVVDFGEYLFHALADAHKDLVSAYHSPTSLLAEIESVIHRDVRKIYSSAELPQFDVLDHIEDEYIVLDYKSKRPFAGLAHGLIFGCLAHFDVKEKSSVAREDINLDGTHSVFKVNVKHEIKDDKRGNS